MKSLKSIFVQAEMEGKSIVIVEGIDDKRIYSTLAKKLLNRDILVYPANYFVECNADNSENVIKAITLLQADFKDEKKLQKVLGIIDRDTTCYKNPEKWVAYKELKGLFILKHYSIETYFATSHNLSELIAGITHATPSEIAMVLPNLIKKIEDTTQVLYYMALDALKERCLGSNNYQAFRKIDVPKLSDITGGMGYFETTLLPQIKEALDTFAKEKGLDVSFVKHVVKGKWYLFHFVKKSDEALKSDTTFTYRMSIDHKTLYEMIMNYFDPNEFSDIIHRLKQLN